MRLTASRQPDEVAVPASFDYAAPAAAALYRLQEFTQAARLVHRNNHACLTSVRFQCVPSLGGARRCRAVA
jgi:hypothetical protein